MLDLVLPKGSLEAETLLLFEEAQLPVCRASDREYSASIGDPWIRRVKILCPQEIALAVQSGHFDLGVTGHDWVLEPAADVQEVVDLGFNRGQRMSARIILAVPSDSEIGGPEEIPPGFRIFTEYPRLTTCFFERLGIPVAVSLSYGATEAKVPVLADAIVDFTETGLSLRRAGLREIWTLAKTSTRLIANRAAWADLCKRQAIEEIRTLLAGVLTARGKVLIKLNVPIERLPDVVALLSAVKASSVSPLFGVPYFAVEAVVIKSNINILIPRLKQCGAEDILELPIARFVW